MKQEVKAVSILVLMALLLDHFIGEVKRFHPLVGFGNYAHFVERKLYSKNGFKAQLMGVIAWVVTIAPFLMVSMILENGLTQEWLWIAEVVVLYLAIGQKSLCVHAMEIVKPLVNYDLVSARLAVAKVVSRDTQDLSEQKVSMATVETVTENTNDAIIAPIFYFVLFGLPGVVLFRLANTLDAMWGYRSERYEHFGKFTARVDDVLGFIPARLTVLCMVVARPKQVLPIFKSVIQTGRHWYSANAGWVMAAGAGALNSKLGGDANYQGITKPRLTLGFGYECSVQHIKQSIRLMYHCTFALLMSLMVFDVLYYFGEH